MSYEIRTSGRSHWFFSQAQTLDWQNWVSQGQGASRYLSSGAQAATKKWKVLQTSNP